MAFKKVSELPEATIIEYEDLFLISHEGKSYRLTYEKLIEDISEKLSTEDN